MCTKLYIFFIRIYFFILIQIGDFRQNKSLPHFSIQNTHLYIFCIHLYMFCIHLYIFCIHLYIFCILFFNGLDIPLVKVYIAYVMHLKPGVYLETRIFGRDFKSAVSSLFDRKVSATKSVPQVLKMS